MSNSGTIYYYTYLGLPFCGTEKVPIHSTAVETLPDTAFLASKTKGLVTKHFKIESMPKTKFYLMRWPR